MSVQWNALKKQTGRSFVKFPGRITYCTNFIDCAIICDDLYNRAKTSSELFVIGFDMEWPFDFTSGAGKTSLIQICPNHRECFVLHISEMTTLPKALTVLLSHSNLKITGVNVRNDIHKLARDFYFAQTDKEKMLNNCVDTMCPRILNDTLHLNARSRWSMEKLVNHLFNMDINKDKKIRMSRWHIIPLSKAQLEYAATDAYVSLLIYDNLEKLKMAQSV